MLEQDSEKWAIVRLAVVAKKNEISQLLFATVTSLVKGRYPPNSMKGIDMFKIEKDNIVFRRVVMTQKDAKSWYLSLKEGDCQVPKPSREYEVEERYDNEPLLVTHLRDDLIWPNLGLPIIDNILNSGKHASHPAPFTSNRSERIHRRLGNYSTDNTFEAFLNNSDAVKFISRRMHINLVEYKEYLGSTVYIEPDPIIKSVDCFMVPKSEEHGEQIFYRITPHLNQNLEKLTITTFDKEASLLSSFTPHKVPTDGILIIDKHICMGDYGYVITHEELGVLTYQPPVSFLRSMNFNINVSSANKTIIKAPQNSKKNADSSEYTAKSVSELASQNSLGNVDEHNPNILIKRAERIRKRRDNIEYYGQTWFPADSRKEALDFIRQQLNLAQKRIYIADPYLEPLQLPQCLYSTSGGHMEVVLFTEESKINGHLESFKQYAEKLFERQAFRVQLKSFRSKDLHDRFLVIDDTVWLIGTSLNSLGTNGALVVKLPNAEEVLNILDNFKAKSKKYTLFDSGVADE